jgi:hypothetical protein
MKIWMAYDPSRLNQSKQFGSKPAINPYYIRSGFAPVYCRG